MTADEKEEGRGFKVQDRRRFSESGEVRDAEAPDNQRAADAPPTPPPASAPAATGRSGPTPSAAADPEPEINFSTFILSLSTQALAHLGEIPNPVDNTVAADLAAARHMIDILGMLRLKTTGNLDGPEQALLDHILFDLRMRYVESSRPR